MVLQQPWQVAVPSPVKVVVTMFQLVVRCKLVTVLVAVGANVVVVVKSVVVDLKTLAWMVIWAINLVTLVLELDTMVVMLVVLDILDAVVDTRGGLDTVKHCQVGVAEDVLDVVAPAISLPDAQVWQPKW